MYKNPESKPQKLWDGFWKHEAFGFKGGFLFLCFPVSEPLGCTQVAFSKAPARARTLLLKKKWVAIVSRQLCLSRRWSIKESTKYHGTHCRSRGVGNAWCKKQCELGPEHKAGNWKPRSPSSHIPHGSVNNSFKQLVQNSLKEADGFFLYFTWLWVGLSLHLGLQFPSIYE